MHSLARATAGKGCPLGRGKAARVRPFPRLLLCLTLLFSRIDVGEQEVTLAFCCVFLLTSFARFLVFRHLLSLFFCCSALGFQSLLAAFSLCFLRLCLSAVFPRHFFCVRNHTFRLAKPYVLATETIPFGRQKVTFCSTVVAGVAGKAVCRASRGLCLGCRARHGGGGGKASLWGGLRGVAVWREQLGRARAEGRNNYP